MTVGDEVGRIFVVLKTAKSPRPASKVSFRTSTPKAEIFLRIISVFNARSSRGHRDVCPLWRAIGNLNSTDGDDKAMKNARQIVRQRLIIKSATATLIFEHENRLLQVFRSTLLLCCLTLAIILPGVPLGRPLRASSLRVGNE